MTPLVSRLAATGLVVLAVVFAPGCRRAASGPHVRTFVGYVENSDAFIALVRVEDAVVAYVCDSRSTAAWLRGEAEGRAFVAASGEGRLRADFGKDAVTGTFTSAQGGAYPFTARPAAGGAGFYRATATLAGAAYVGGWVLLGNGQQRGAVKRDGVILQGPALDPARPAVALPGGGTLEAFPAARMLTEAEPPPRVAAR